MSGVAKFGIMKSPKIIPLLVIAIAILLAGFTNLQAQVYNTKRTVTFYAHYTIQTSPTSLDVCSNDVITIKSLDVVGDTTQTGGGFSPGNFILSFADGGNYNGTLLSLTNKSIEFTGITNISFVQPRNGSTYLG